MKKAIIGVVLLLAVLVGATTIQESTDSKISEDTGNKATRKKGIIKKNGVAQKNATTGKNGANTSNKTLTLVSLDNSVYLRNLVEQYNQTHTEYRIEIRKYDRSEELSEDGVLRLQREIAAGEGPDLIDFGREYSVSDITGRYTEDLYSCLETDDYFENILASFSYQQGLYAVPLGFSLHSFVGAKECLGEGNSWTIEEMMECYRTQQSGKMLYPGEMKMDVFGTILTGSMEYYIDWETGECAFDGQDFKEVMEFCNLFPERLDFSESSSVKQLYLEDRALLMPIVMTNFYDICRAECVFGDREVTFIGFPVKEDCGTVIKPWGPVLAVSRNSGNREAAEEFVRWCLGVECQEGLPEGFPICREAFEKGLVRAMEPEYEVDAEGGTHPKAKAQVVFEGETPVDIYCLTAQQAGQLLELIQAATINNAVDRKLYNIFLEEIPYYFHGDKSLEETAKVIQARVSVYVNERR